MSLPVMVWVMEHSEAQLGERLVLLVLAEYAHDDGSKAFPAVETTIRKTRMSRRGVQEALRRLREKGMVEQTGSTATGTHVYRVVMGAHELRGGAQNLRGVGGADAARGGAQITASKGAESAPNPLGPNNKDPRELKLPVAASDDDANVDEVMEVWEAYDRTRVAVLGAKSKAKLTPARRQLIRRRRKDWDQADLVDAVQGWRHSPHNCGMNDRGSPFCDLELILRDAKHIEKFRDLHRHGPTPTATARTNGDAATSGRTLAQRREDGLAALRSLQAKEGITWTP